MSHQSDLIASNIEAYLAQHEKKELLRFLTCGNVDDGKSTLIGRLLHDSKLIYEDHLTALRKDSAKFGTTGDDFDPALLMDGLQAEREQGITIDVAYRYFSTSKRKFIIADTPGHEQYTRNMATGASTCDLAIILIDARHGVQTQTCRHTYIVSLLGIRHIVVAVNKMDLVEFSFSAFDRICSDYLKFANKLDLHDIWFIPISALKGDNVVNKSDHLSWYEGPSLMTLLETIEISEDRNFTHPRFPVQYVNRPNLNFRGYSGTVASGIFKKGDTVIALPSKKTSRITSIVTYDGLLEEAFPLQSVTFTLEDEIDISRGDMLVPPDTLPAFDNRLLAHLIWMAEVPLLLGKQYTFKHTTRTVLGSVQVIRHRTDVNTQKSHQADQLQLNEIGLCEIVLTVPIAFDAYSVNKTTGAFILIDRLTNITIGAGMIVGTVEKQQTFQRVSAADRRARFGQKPATIWITGEKGSELAYGLERQLFDLGHVTTVLDRAVEDYHNVCLIVEEMMYAGIICLVIGEMEPTHETDGKSHLHISVCSDYTVEKVMLLLRQKGILIG